MLEIIEKALADHDVDSRDKVLLALSGGLDSCVLLKILLDLGYEPHLAHANYQLREEAKEDEQFCRNLARQHGLVFHTEVFATQAFAEEQKLSIQMAARELRYDFFERLDEKEGYRAILTAHHGDDNLETILFKLARGSALEAIAGIRPQRGKFLRPMLRVYRKDILQFAQDHALQWHEDASNAETKYLRNAYRHRLIPLWEEIQADLKPKMNVSSRLLRQQSDALESLLKEKLTQILKREQEIDRFYFESVFDQAYFLSLLYKWLQPYGEWDWSALMKLWKSKKGQYTENHEYRIYLGEGFYELRPQQESPDLEILITADQRSIEQHPALEMDFYEREAIAIDGKSEHLFLDADLLDFPITLRNWRPGDRFQPLGMSGRKKLSDYWIDIKLPMAEKAHQYVLEKNSEIIAVLGHRIDHRYRITNSTKTVYFVRLKK